MGIFIDTIGIDFVPCNILSPTSTVVIPGTIVTMHKEIWSRLEFFCLGDGKCEALWLSCSSEL